MNQQKSHNPQNFSNILIDLLVCIIIPTLILKKLSADTLLGSHWALVAALFFPLTKGLYDFKKLGKITLFPSLGIISTLLTGGIGLLQLPSSYIAIKEALIPFILGIIVFISSYTSRPLIRQFIYNDIILNVDKVSLQLEKRNQQEAFNRVMKKATIWLAFSFLISAILNYMLAKWIVVSPSGTAAFNDELGTMTLISYPVILLPCMIIVIGVLYYLFKQIKSLTGLSIEELIKNT